MNTVRVAGRDIGPKNPCFIVAEMSANHDQSYQKAVEIVHAAKEAGADAVKLQTYTPDTITIKSDNNYFRINKGAWSGQTLYELYQKAYMPWEWQPKLKEEADKIGLTLFSTPFDVTAVDFLAKIEVSAYKIASFELVDIPLIKYIAKQGKPIIMSTGMGTLGEIEEAIQAARNAGATQIALLKCTSAYPAPPEEMNLHVIPHLAEAFGVPVGLSDHTLGIAVPVAAVALGACIIEKHFALYRDTPGPDSAFSLEPQEFMAMVAAIRTTEKALGKVNYDVTEHEAASRIFRRSLFVVKDIKAGDTFTEENIRSIRPGYGLSTKYLDVVLGKKTKQDIKSGTPLNWDIFD